MRVKRFTREEFVSEAQKLTEKAASEAVKSGRGDVAVSITLAGAAIITLFEHELFETDDFIEIVKE